MSNPSPTLTDVAYELDQPCPEVGDPGVDTDLAYAIAHARHAERLALSLPDWTISTALMSVTSCLMRQSMRSASAAVALEIPAGALEDHIRQALDACERYLAQHPRTREVQCARDDLFRCHHRDPA